MKFGANGAWPAGMASANCGSDSAGVVLLSRICKICEIHKRNRG